MGTTTTASARLDLYREHAAEYVARRTPQLVTMKPAWYLGIAGSGDPSGNAFQDAVGALYPVAFTLKKAKKAEGRDYTVAKLEGLWWGNEPGQNMRSIPYEKWQWKLMIRVPEFITKKDVRAVTEGLIAGGKPELVRQVELEKLNEGKCVQVLHVGPYSGEPQTIALMHAFALEQGLRFHGVHHEIYLNDPGRVAPEKLRTILRQPVRSGKR